MLREVSVSGKKWQKRTASNCTDLNSWVQQIAVPIFSVRESRLERSQQHWKAAP